MTATAVDDRPLTQLRALRKQSWTGAGDVLPQLLPRLTDPLDRESAGALLARDAARDALVAEGLVPATVAVLASSTVNCLGPLLLTGLAERGVAGRLLTAGYDRWEEEVLLGGAGLAEARPRVSLLVLDDQTVLGRVADPLDVAAVAAECQALVERVSGWTRQAHDAWGGRIVLTTVPLSAARRAALRDFRRRNRLEAEWARMNAALLDLGDDPGITVVSLDSLAAAAPVAAAAQVRLTSSQVYSTALLDQLARDTAAIVDADLGRSRKVLALDLDNTLWSGVVGDDGIGGIAMGGGYPGNAFAGVQRAALQLQRQGVLLVVCSKNDDDVARAAIAEHPDMVLRPEHFVDVVADWNPKPDNLAGIVDRLNVGVESVVFLDDNPAERALMRQAQPRVATVEVNRPEDLAYALVTSRLFDAITLSDEDERRTAMYRDGAARETSRRTAASLDEFLLDLATTVELEDLDEFNRDRIAQLFGKTNQFNLTGQRYQTADLDELVAAGGRVVGVRVADRFGDSGLVAALALRPLGSPPGAELLVENMVVSCRVFTRNVEQAVLISVLHAARESGAAAVTGLFRPGPKNARFHDVYGTVGFASVSTGGPADAHPDTTVWRHDLAQIPDAPTWTHVTRPLTSSRQNGTQS